MDPELEVFVPLFPHTDTADPVGSRKAFAGIAASVPTPEVDGLTVEDVTVPPVVPGAPDVPVRVYRPLGARGAVVWLHGGGYVMGTLDTEHPWATRLAAASGQTVVAVGYRLAPEDPYPAALDDAWAVLHWAADHSARLGAAPDRIAVGGHSAGGGLAAALALRARDQRGPAIRFQLLNQPQLDDRQETWSQRHFTDTPWTDRAKVAASWRYYLGGAEPTPLAAPGRATDLSGLPPAYLATAELCPNRDEGFDYALRLLRAGVAVEMHHWPGTFHGSQAVVTAEISQRQNAELGDALRRALTG